jgi:S-adenosyl methyltransferase
VPGSYAGGLTRGNAIGQERVLHSVTRRRRPHVDLGVFRRHPSHQSRLAMGHAPVLLTSHTAVLVVDSEYQKAVDSWRYDALLGEDNYAPDREAVRQVLKPAPEARDSARANRAFLQRAVRFLVGEGASGRSSTSAPASSLPGTCTRWPGRSRRRPGSRTWTTTVAIRVVRTRAGPVRLPEANKGKGSDQSRHSKCIQAS